MKETITRAACAAMVVAAVGQLRADQITFKGRISSIESSGIVNAISPYIAVGDMFSGTFSYDPNAIGSSSPTINNVGQSMQYGSAVTGFSLTFTSGNSTGYSINGYVPSQSSMTVSDDILNSSFGPITDITSAVFWHPAVEFRPGLRQRNLVYRFWDFNEAAMVDSADLNDWNADQVFANFDTQFNELAFNSSATDFAQIAKFEFTEFNTAAVPEPHSLAALGGMAAVGLVAAARRRRKQAA